MTRSQSLEELGMYKKAIFLIERQHEKEILKSLPMNIELEQSLSIIPQKLFEIKKLLRLYKRIDTNY